ncbi:MAG TPA: hypothetical protein VIR03_00770 [Candidatus Saccharimonadales bacterium]
MRKALIFGALCFLGVLVLFSTTDPNKVPSFVLPVPFVLLFISLLVAAMWLLQKHGMGMSRSVRVGTLCASIPIVILVLQSIGQLTVKDVLTIVVLFAVSYFYIARSAVSS